MVPIVVHGPRGDPGGCHGAVSTATMGAESQEAPGLRGSVPVALGMFFQLLVESYPCPGTLALPLLQATAAC